MSSSFIVRFFIVIVIIVHVAISFLKASAYDGFFNYFKKVDAMFFSLIISLIVFFTLTLVLGIGKALFTKELNMIWKTLISALIFIIIAEAFLIYWIDRYPVTLPGFDFSDLGRDKAYPNWDLITIQGTWVSDQNSTPIQTTRIDCWRSKKSCIEATSQIAGYKLLNLFIEYEEIESWGDDKIILKDDESAHCTSYSTIIDRKNKTVVSVRSTKKPKLAECEGIQDEEIVLHLTDGWKNKY